MNDCSIRSERHNLIKIGGVTFNKLLLTLLNNRFIQYDTNIIIAFSSDISIHIRINWTPPVSIIPDTLLSR